MAIKAGRSVTFSLTLDSGGIGIPVPITATVTAQVMAADGTTPLSAVLPVLANEIGANWSQGLVVVELSATDTASVIAPQCALLVTVTNAGNSRTWLTYIPVAGAIPEATALFARDTIIPRFRADRLPRILAYLGDTVSDDYIWDAIKAAEADASHQLRALFEPTTVFAGDPTDAEIAALGTNPYLIEPAYDFEPIQWQGDRFGFFATRQKPVQSVLSVDFTWAGAQTIFSIPANWVRCDRKYGQIQFVPSLAQNVPLSMYMMQAIGGGRIMPQMIRMRYVAGLENAALDYPDLIDLVQRMAILRMLTDAMLPGSSSISADGLSQSTSPPDLDKLGDAITLAIGRLRDRIHGIRVAFL